MQVKNALVIWPGMAANKNKKEYLLTQPKRVYYKEAVGAFVVFDVTRTNTFENTEKWKGDIDGKVDLSVDHKPIPMVLLANKVFILIPCVETEPNK